MASVKRGGVRILFRARPFNKNNALPAPFGTGDTTAAMSPVADQFTNNPNPLYDPSKAPSNVQIKVARKPAQVVSKGERTKAERTHGKVFKPNRTTLFGGKRLKKY